MSAQTPRREKRVILWKCEICDFAFTSQAEKDAHPNSKRHLKNMGCITCGIVYSSVEERKTHQESQEHQLIIRKCEICDYPLTSQSEIEAHPNSKLHLKNVRDNRNKRTKKMKKNAEVQRQQELMQNSPDKCLQPTVSELDEMSPQIEIQSNSHISLVSHSRVDDAHTNVQIGRMINMIDDAEESDPPLLTADEAEKLHKLARRRSGVLLLIFAAANLNQDDAKRVRRFIKNAKRIEPEDHEPFGQVKRQLKHQEERHHEEIKGVPAKHGEKSEYAQIDDMYRPETRTQPPDDTIAGDDSEQVALKSIVDAIKLNYNYVLENLHSFLAPYSFLDSAEAKAGVPRSHMCLGVLVFIAALIVFVFGGNAFINLIGFIYPCYASHQALGTESFGDSRRWLWYWGVYGFFACIESFVLDWVPLYYLLKAGILIWCMLNQTAEFRELMARWLAEAWDEFFADGGQQQNSKLRVQGIEDYVLSDDSDENSASSEDIDTESSDSEFSYDSSDSDVDSDDEGKSD